MFIFRKKLSISQIIFAFSSKFVLFVILSIFILAAFQRIQFFSQEGKDMQTYSRAINDLFLGINPYIWTIDSYSNPKDPGNHGYAYLPGLLYTQGTLYLISLLTNLPYQYLWKLPVLFADIGVGILLVKFLYKKNLIALNVALLIWFWNPYFFYKQNYVYTEPLPVFFVVLALYFLKKDAVLTGIFYALAVIFKPFPIILFPLFMLFTKDKPRFLLAAALVSVFVSLPFISSLTNIITYLRGAFFVHSNRFMQGRPFLFYISYYYDIELFQIIPLKVYTFLATFSGWFIVVLIYFCNETMGFCKMRDFSEIRIKGIKVFSKLTNKYVLATIPFLTFYIFTPVLNRTYLIWLLPVFITASYDLFFTKFKIPILYYLVLISYWLFYYWYLAQWKDGFHIWHP